METSGRTVESYEIALLTICLENSKTFAGFAKYWQLGSKGEILYLVLFRADVFWGFVLIFKWQVIFFPSVFPQAPEQSEWLLPLALIPQEENITCGRTKSIYFNKGEKKNKMKR